MMPRSLGGFGGGWTENRQRESLSATCQAYCSRPGCRWTVYPLRVNFVLTLDSGTLNGSPAKVTGGGGGAPGSQVLGQAVPLLGTLWWPAPHPKLGIAAILGIAMSLFEMVSNLAVDRLLVQAEDGDDPVFQATAHAFQVLRGIGIALFLFLLAWPFSRLFDVPHVMWAFQCIALVPLIRGFMHLDPKRLQREFGFGADVATERVPQIVLVLAAWPCLVVRRLYCNALATGLSGLCHGGSEPLSLGASIPGLGTRDLHPDVFSWPLLVNGLLMFFIFQETT